MRTMKKLLLILIALAVVLAVLNPSEADYREHVREKQGVAGSAAMAVTSALNYQFLRPCRPGPLFADAHMLRLGKRLAVMDVRIWTDDADKPVGQANVTYAIP